MKYNNVSLNHEQCSNQKMPSRWTKRLRSYHLSADALKFNQWLRKISTDQLSDIYPSGSKLLQSSIHRDRPNSKLMFQTAVKTYHCPKGCFQLQNFCICFHIQTSNAFKIVFNVSLKTRFYLYMSVTNHVTNTVRKNRVESESYHEHGKKTQNTVKAVCF